MNQEGGSRLTSNLLAPDVGLPASGTMGHKCLSFKPLVYDVPLKQAELRQRGRGQSQNHSKIMRHATCLQMLNACGGEVWWTKSP